MNFASINLEFSVWFPISLILYRFNATNMLELIRGKRLVFVGDSINRNQWESMLCLLMSAIKDPKRVYETHGRRITKEKGNYCFRFVVIIVYVNVFVFHMWIWYSYCMVWSLGFRITSARLNTMFPISWFMRARQELAGNACKRWGLIRLIEAHLDGKEPMFWSSTPRIGGIITKQDLG